MGVYGGHEKVDFQKILIFPKFSNLFRSLKINEKQRKSIQNLKKRQREEPQGPAWGPERPQGRSHSLSFLQISIGFPSFFVDF